MENDSSDPAQTHLEEKSSLLAYRLSMHLKQPSNQFVLSQSQTISMSIDHQQDLFISGTALHTLPNFPNLGPLVRLNTDVRLARASLRKFVNSDTLFYPFEVLVTIRPPQPTDFMWDFKHKFYLSIMYSQVCRFFFPFNRNNSQLFFIIDMGGTSEPLCVNIPSRTLLRSVSEALMNHEEMGAKQFENCLMIAISAYKDYAAFFTNFNMRCKSCNVDKPSNEYPSEPLTKTCRHPLLQICIRCCLKSVDSAGVCPYRQCASEVEQDSESASVYRLQLESVVYDYRDKEVSVAQPQPPVPQFLSIPLNLSVSFMSGDTASISVNSRDSLTAFKQKLQERMDDRPPVREIKILMGGSSLEGDHRTLSELGITSGCTGLRAIRVLYEVPSDLNKIRFSMSWGWPDFSHNNYLDTACITFSKVGGRITHLHNIDFRSTWWRQAHEYACYANYIEHCGNADKNYSTQRNTSTFNVWVQNLDHLEVRGQPVTHLLFLMSAWRRPSMQGYKIPMLEFYDSSQPTQSLYEGTLEFSRFSNYRGLIVCLLKKDHGVWQIVRVARPFTAGDATNYCPIVEVCRRVVEEFG